MKGFLDGFLYNLKGLGFAMKHRRLLLLGMTRLVFMLVLAVACWILVLAYRDEILSLIWTKPESGWILLLRELFSWVFSLLLLGLSAVLSYVLSQITFSAVLMDLMSRTTEKLVTGGIGEPPPTSLFKHAAYLVGQEIPRNVLPLVLTLVLLGLGWMTPAGPIVTAVSPLAAAVLLAWDNTDLLPARRMLPFRDRFRMLVRSLPFHLGFGLWFLIPLANVLFLSFAPVGATLYQVEREAS